jgi:hypothetical protein
MSMRALSLQCMSHRNRPSFPQAKTQHDDRLLTVEDLIAPPVFFFKELAHGAELVPKRCGEGAHCILLTCHHVLVMSLRFWEWW